ncbi:hypothetical protein [Streptomyces sp. WAC04114]|uniref:hypothetical protein n=1 Tax=Streptomyces sp. WAC04114 TaxID=2867961 RepID=UPI001C8CA80F|nr:hypothetical protein [Streptomyces sp. WAC04114]MBX9366020.1 hypothetical protein [Streptomyces sp. WAC04114]
MNAPDPGAARPARRREVVLRIALPGKIPACTAVLGTGSVGATLLHGTLPTASPLVRPLVALALGAMAYDVGLRALRRHVG